RPARSARAFGSRAASIVVRSSSSSGTVRWFRPMATTDTRRRSLWWTVAQLPKEECAPASPDALPGRGSCHVGRGGVGAHRPRSVGTPAVEAEDLELDGEVDLSHRHLRVDGE